MRQPPNGMAQRQRRGKRDSFAIIAPFLAKRAGFERQSRCPLEPVLGGLESLSYYHGQIDLV